jgi:hypothetical protein
LEEK